MPHPTRILLVLAVLMTSVAAEDPQPITIRTDFPGGNVQITQREGRTVHLAPDLRGGREWFYWYFEAESEQAGRATFVFPKKVIGRENGAIGHQGPAISTDGGQSWRWMGLETVEENAFHYNFERPGQKVRFAVTIPYVQSDLEAFLKRHRKNEHLKIDVLTKSREGRDVTLLHIGQPDPKKQILLLTARHHAVETMASYVLEGMLAEAMSDSEPGRLFRQQYVLHAVPIVDRDGVENGDQGKNRRPYDHNRDYNEVSIYPEIQAIKEFAADRVIPFALDLHCPTLVYEDHQIMYFVGSSNLPSNNLTNVKQFAERIRNNLPKTAPIGPAVWLKPEKKFSPKSSRYFAFRDGAVMSATLEIPFAPKNREMGRDDCRAYGRAILRAFVETNFVDD